MSFTEIIIPFVGGGFIGYFVKYYFDLKLVKHSEAMARKREVYEEIAIALGVFVSGREVATEEKNRFLKESSKLWLWASDSVVQTLNDFIDVMIEYAKPNGKIDQDKAKQTYANFVIEMRKDLGFPKTSLKFDEYRFVSFRH